APAVDSARPADRTDDRLGARRARIRLVRGCGWSAAPGRGSGGVKQATLPRHVSVAFTDDRVRSPSDSSKWLNRRHFAEPGTPLAALKHCDILVCHKPSREEFMKSILDPSFRYISSANTDLRKTFARIRREQRKAALQLEPVKTGTILSLTQARRAA